MNGNDVDLMCEIFDLATPTWRGSFAEFRAAISTRPRLSAGRLVTEAQCLIPELIGGRILFQQDLFDHRKIIISNIDACFSSEDPKPGCESLDPNGLSQRYQIIRKGSNEWKITTRKT